MIATISTKNNPTTEDCDCQYEPKESEKEKQEEKKSECLW